MPRPGDSSYRASVLVVDDEAAIRDSLHMILEYEGYRVEEAANGSQALTKVGERAPDAVVLDIKMPEMDGLELLKALRERGYDMPVLMISGHADVATAVEATRRGAFDFFEKPLQRERVLLSLRNAIEAFRLQTENRTLRPEPEQIIGTAPSVRRLREMIEKAAPTPATVLVTGESGTGKELVARAIHRLSSRRDRTIVQVNCAAIPEELIESELFGHEKGSFTGAVRKAMGKFVAADGGTIFLDEIGDMSARTQAKVLRVLQNGEVEPVGAERTIQVDVRVVAATNRNLEDEIAAGRFREDLFYRLNVIPIRTPALREHLEDLPLLVDYFVRRYSDQNNYKPKELAARGDGPPQGPPLEGERPRAQEPRRAHADPLARRQDHPRGRDRGHRRRAPRASPPRCWRWGPCASSATSPSACSSSTSWRRTTGTSPRRRRRSTRRAAISTKSSTSTTYIGREESTREP